MFERTISRRKLQRLQELHEERCKTLDIKQLKRASMLVESLCKFYQHPEVSGESTCFCITAIKTDYT